MIQDPAIKSLFVQNTSQGYRLLVLVLLSLVLMFADSRFDYLSTVRYYTSMVVTPIYYVAGFPARAMDGFLGLFQSRRELIDRAISLEEELLMQRYQLQKLDHLTAENRRLNELLNASAIVEERVERTQLIGESPDPFVKRILINKGGSDGVYLGQMVVDAFGLMGQVVEVDPATSWVLLITDPQHATPIQVNRNGVRAIAAGVNDSLHLLSLNNIPNTADIEVGDVLVTSGLGGRFPAGYPVGVVEHVQFNPGKPFAEVVVVPTALLDRSRNLLLVFEQESSAAEVIAPAFADDVQESASESGVPRSSASPEGGAASEGTDAAPAVQEPAQQDATASPAVATPVEPATSEPAVENN